MDETAHQKPKPKPRVSLTKSQLEDPAAIELLALLQSVTADGKLIDDEVRSLKEWLDSQRESSLPAIKHLIGVVEEVLADGRITEQELEYLQKAIETVLPREHREVAVLRRRERVADEKKQKAEAIQKSRPIADFDFMVAGVFFEGRQQIIPGNVTAGDTVYLSREPQNQYSRNATAIRIQKGHKIGYVPETEAVTLAPILDQGARQSAAVKKILNGRRGLIPVVWGELYPADSPLADATTQADILERIGPEPKFQSPMGSDLQAVPKVENLQPKSGAQQTDPSRNKYRPWMIVIALLLLAYLILTFSLKRTNP